MEIGGHPQGTLQILLPRHKGEAHSVPITGNPAVADLCGQRQPAS